MSSSSASNATPLYFTQIPSQPLWKKTLQKRHANWISKCFTYYYVLLLLILCVINRRNYNCYYEHKTRKYNNCCYLFQISDNSTPRCSVECCIIFLTHDVNIIYLNVTPVRRDGIIVVRKTRTN